MARHKKASVSAVMRFASLGEYRRRTIRSLLDAVGEDLHIQAGDSSPDGSVRILTSDDVVELQTLRNHYLPRDILIQGSGLGEAVRAKKLVADLNPRVIDVWLLLLIRRVLGRPTLLWGHAWPRRGSSDSPGLFRALMRKLSSGVITYTRTQARELSEVDPSTPVFCAPNSLYFKRECSFDSLSVARNRVIYVGRLIPEKKVDVLLRAFDVAWQSEHEIRLTIVGDGPEARHLKELCSSMASSGNVDFLGHVAERDKLAAEYGKSFLAVSPGYAGLSVTQSISFGVPVAVSRHEPHAPEVEALKSGFNSLYFDTDNVVALAECIMRFWRERNVWLNRGPRISEMCGEDYSVEVMVAGLLAAIGK